MTAKEYTEADLCRSFAEWAKKRGWEVYPETGGADMLLVAVGDTRALVHADHAFKAGAQIRVEAKLEGNMKVLAQACALPDWKIVLVGRASVEFVEVARQLGICVVAKVKQTRVFGRKKWTIPGVGDFHIIGYVTGNPAKPVCLPPVVPDLPAGGKSPRQLTPWRLKALKMVSRLSNDGTVTSADFKELGIFRPRWVKNAWVVGCRTDDGTGVAYKAGPRINEVLEGYETVYAQLSKAGEFDR